MNFVSIVKELKKKFSSNSQLKKSASDENSKSKLVLVYQGLQGSWVNMGRGLYKSNSVYRNSINRCIEHIKTIDSIDLSDAFVTDEGAKRACESQPLRIYLSGIIQIALTDLWLSLGLKPDAVLGLSLGEIPASYLNGVLSLEDAITMLKILRQWENNVSELASVFVIQEDLTTTRKIASMVSEELTGFGALGPRCTVIICQDRLSQALSEVLQTNEVDFYKAAENFSYHLPQNEAFKQNFAQLVVDLKPRSAKIETFSSMHGGRLPANIKFDSSFWYAILGESTFYCMAAEAAIKSGGIVFLNIGTYGSLTNFTIEVAQNLETNIEILDSMTKGEDEQDTFEKAFNRLKELGYIDREQCAPVNEAQDLDAKKMTVTADNFDPLSQDFVSDPYGQLAQLRNLGAVHFLSKDNCWLVLNYDDVAASLRNTEIFSSSPWRETDTVLAGADPAEHSKAQKALRPLFDRTSLDKLAEIIRLSIDALLDQHDAELEFDLAKISLKITEVTVSKFLGLSETDTSDLESSVGEKIYNDGAKIEQLAAYFRNYLNSDENKASNSFYLSLVSTAEGAALTIAEIADAMKLIFIAGTSSTAMLINNAVKILLSDVALQTSLRNDLNSLPQFLEEVLRFDPPVHTDWRSTLAETKIAGTVIPANSLVKFSLAAANRDPNKFEKADTFLSRRSPNHHLSFGVGIHNCIGATLARMEALIVLERLLTKYPQLAAAEPKRSLRYSATYFARDIESLMVTTVPLKHILH